MLKQLLVLQHMPVLCSIALEEVGTTVAVEEKDRVGAGRRGKTTGNIKITFLARKS